MSVSDFDFDYYQRRAAAEAKRALSASLPEVAWVHEKLSEAYRDRLKTIKIPSERMGG